MKYFRQMNYYDEIFALATYQKDVGEFQEADLAFQANKYSRWSWWQKSAYIGSIILGKAPSKFIFADAQKCLAAAIERGDKNDITYFQKKVDSDIKFINVDSNNRNNVIDDFIKNKIPLVHGKYEIGDATVTVDEDNDTYDTLDPVLREAFDRARISISVYTDATREELSELFRNVNDGKPLMHPEILNSYTTLVANTVRELADTYGDYFAGRNKWFSKRDINRRGIDQFIANMAFVFCYDIKKGISKSNMENFYRDGSDGEFQILKFKNTFKEFMSEVMTENAYAIANRNSVFDLFVIYCEMKNKKYKIADNWEFLKSYMTAVASLLTNGEYYNVQGFKDPKSFKVMVGGLQKSNVVLRNQLIMEIFDVDSHVVKLDPKRTYNATERMILAVRDDFMTPEGKKINPSELHTDKYAGGHGAIPHKDGGPTTIENGVIQTKEDNLKLGGNPLKV